MLWFFMDDESNNFGFSTKCDKGWKDFLFENVVTPDNFDDVYWLKDFPNDKLGELIEHFKKQNGVVLVYNYNYPMADRGGFVVVDKDDTTKFIACKNYMMG